MEFFIDIYWRFQYWKRIRATKKTRLQKILIIASECFT